ncbi:DNA replication/repair protein RecF [Sphingomonas oleivorans]|uniref:DNA replication and repair protein RecF n=1 Tax=Sphingomonas oleivorans TaxID=1735121 RepID=A0A2T5G2S6_9SPHN|nr:DNA replication/repair protein RecF [Sphingomonas oleivorans]PTQ13447.1 DNA replication/repair protein RecF [Sphingomonas oleivorans]
MTAVSRLSLTDFRSYRDAAIAAGAGFVVLTGENGAGKTNVLEAVSLLTAGRGLRQAALSQMARSDGPGGFAVAARVTAPGGEVEIGTGTLPTAPERRQVRINGAAATAAALGEWLSILWLTPAMDRLFVEGASGRRRFLDRLVLAREPGHAVHAARYEAAMRARNKLLAEPEGADAAWLTALEAGMAEHGAAVAEARQRTVKALAMRLEAQPQGPFARAGLALEGWRPGEEAERALAAELRQSRGRDAAAGRTLVGPHRSDLAVTHLDKDQPAERCSTGEQKALLLGVVLAHADLVAEDRGSRPVLLLDEVAAHLDPLRREALFARLAAAGGQVWMTGTERALFDALGEGTSWLAVADGTVHPG